MLENEEYINLKDIIERYAISKGSMRHFIRFRADNGLQDIIRKVGRRLLFKKVLFNEWIERKVMK